MTNVTPEKFAVCLLVFIGVVFINTFSAKADVYAGNSNSKLELISQDSEFKRSF